MTRPPVPPLTAEAALRKVLAAERRIHGPRGPDEDRPLPID